MLLEQTGHYHRALVQYLLEMDITVYIMPVQRRPPGLLKSDKRDALSLAIHLYNQLELGAQSPDTTHLVRRLRPPTEAAQQLKGWMRHRYELVRECTQRKNKLTAICDELFPEFAGIRASSRTQMGRPRWRCVSTSRRCRPSPRRPWPS